MKKRLRKKLKVKEFTEYMFSVDFKDEILTDDWMDNWIDYVESLDLYCFTAYSTTLSRGFIHVYGKNLLEKFTFLCEKISLSHSNWKPELKMLKT